MGRCTIVNTCGIILAKSESFRLPEKNFLPINGVPMWEHQKNILERCVDDVYVFGDRFGNRPPQASMNDEPLFSALKWAYKTLPKRYEVIVCLMANCPQHTPEGINQAISRFFEINCKELRSFDKNGIESGLLIFDEGYLLRKHEISTYQAAIILDSIEIHTQEDYELVLNS